MKKIVLSCLTLAGMLFVSCGTASFKNLSTFPELEPGSMPPSRYIVLGEVNGSSEITVKTSDLTKEIKNDYSPMQEYLEISVEGDAGKYGFIGKPAKRKMNVFERGAALAEYNLIQVAKCNEADAIICLKTTTDIEPAGSSSKIITRVSGYAVKIKADEGYVIKLPVVAKPEPEVEAKAEAPETTGETSAETTTEGTDGAVSEGTAGQETADAPEGSETPAEN